MYNPKPSHIFAFLLVIVTSMLLVCLWPFDFSPLNKVEWLRDEPGVRYFGLGAIVSRDLFPSVATLSSDRSLTIAVAVRPAKLTARHLSHILTFCPDDAPPALVIGAWKDSLVVRLNRRDSSGQQGYREFGVRNAFRSGDATLVTVTLEPEKALIYLNGQARAQLSTPGPGSGDAPLGTLLLGVSQTGRNEWQGDILGLTIYSRALGPQEVRERSTASSIGDAHAAPSDDTLVVARYDFATRVGDRIRNTAGPRYDLSKPRVFQPLKYTMLEFPKLELRRIGAGIHDVILNILGFVPLGFVAMCAFGAQGKVRDHTKSFTVVLLGFVFSLAIELIQVFLPTRNSSLGDVCTNTFGTAIGITLFFVLLGIKERDSSTSPSCSNSSCRGRR